jgi:hypothetical protein
MGDWKLAGYQEKNVLNMAFAFLGQTHFGFKKNH